MKTRALDRIASGWKILLVVSLPFVMDVSFATPAPAEAPDAAQSIDALIAGLGDSDPRKRAEAAASLERIAGAERETAERASAFRALKEAAASCANLEIRAQAADVLEKVSLEVDRREIAALLDVMKKARDIEEGRKTYEKILGMGHVGAEALVEAFAVDEERFGARKPLYKLEAALSLKKKGPFTPGEETILSATLTNRGGVGVWINPTVSVLDLQLEKSDGKRVSLGKPLAEGIGEMYFKRAFAGSACPYYLLHLAPGESHALTYRVASQEAGTLLFTFHYEAVEREVVEPVLGQANILLQAMNLEVQEQFAWATPFRPIKAELNVLVAGYPIR